MVMFSCFAPQTAHAQGLKITQPGPNCNLFESRFDNPFSDTKGFYQPAIAWHAEYALSSYVFAWGIDKATGHHLPGWLTAGIVIGAYQIPHIRGGFIRRDYPINPLDMTYDFVNRATPAVWAVGNSDDSTRSWLSTHWKPATVWLVTDLALSCWASP
jgi:hypothetical protein